MRREERLNLFTINRIFCRGQPSSWYKSSFMNPVAQVLLHRSIDGLVAAPVVQAERQLFARAYNYARQLNETGVQSTETRELAHFQLEIKL